MAGRGFRPTLRLYDEHLLSAGARFWILCASILILIMATAEAVAWGYVASFLGQSIVIRTAAALFVALSVFAIIWILDATFMTLDLKRSEYEEALHGRKQERPGLARARFWGGVLGRLALVSGSLYLSAPFIAQLIFQQDIDARIQSLNAQKIAQQRLVIEQDFDRQIEALRHQRGALEEQRIEEAAGKGPSGRYGRGPAVRTIELRLEELSAELESRASERKAALASYDLLTTPEVEQRYGVDLVARGLQSRGEILDQILEQDSYQNAELAVRAFLFFLFLALLILKLFQPRSVEIYYSEQLQSLYRRYLGGTFDELLPEAERSTGPAVMDALRFEDWCLGSYGLERIEAQERRFRARQLQEYEERVEMLKQVAARSQSELQPIADQHEAGRARVRALDEELESLRSEIDRDAHELDQQREHLSSIDHSLRHARFEEAAFSTAARVRSELASSEAALAQRIRALEARRAQLARQRESEVSNLVMLDRELARRQGLLAGIESTIRSSREDYVKHLVPGTVENGTAQKSVGKGKAERHEIGLQSSDDQLPWQARLLREGKAR